MRVWCLPVLLTLLAAPAAAHDADIVYAQLSAGKAPGQLAETLTLTSATLQLLAPIDADGDGLLSQGDLDQKAAALAAGVWDEMPLTAGGQRCERSAPRAVLREGFIELSAELQCPAGELRQDFRFLRVLPPNYRVVLGTQLDGDRPGKRFAQGSMTSLTLPQPSPPGAFELERVGAGFDDGLRRGLSLLGLAACLALFLASREWKQAAVAFAAVALGVLVGSVLDGGALAPAIAAGVLIVACVALQPAPLPVGLGLALAVGAWAGGGLAHGLGLAAGTLAVWVVVAPAAVALGRVVGRRPSAWRVARWVPVVLGGAGVLNQVLRLW